ncbi:unnamed protein product [Ixodes pacificus]
MRHSSTTASRRSERPPPPPRHLRLPSNPARPPTKRSRSLQADDPRPQAGRLARATGTRQSSRPFRAQEGRSGATRWRQRGREARPSRTHSGGPRAQPQVRRRRPAAR